VEIVVRGHVLSDVARSIGRSDVFDKSTDFRVMNVHFSLLAR